MRSLPSGTITLLFADIAGSTVLLRRLGDGYAAALAKCRRLLRAALGRHDGVEVGNQGDAFFVAFSSPTEAVAAAAEAQADLQATQMRVRMGLHTGEPTLTDEGYVGMVVREGARIAASAHGGQVALSGDTRARLGEAVSLVDLGDHRLKDIEGRSISSSSATGASRRSGRSRTPTSPGRRARSSEGGARSRRSCHYFEARLG